MMEDRHPLPSRPATPDSDSVKPATGCCGGPAPAGVEACCVRDAEAKANGHAGCGCAKRKTDTG